MVKRVVVAVIGVALLAGCGEKPCNAAGSVKAENGKIYHCVDRNDGSGLRWYR